MQNEYKVSIGNKIFYFAIATFMVGFSLYLFSITEQISWVIIMPLMVLIGAFLIVASQLKREVIVDDDSITKIGLFRTKTIGLNDIKGVRVGQKVIVIESSSDPSLKITINNYSDYAQSDELKDGLSQNYTDLTEADRKAELSGILGNSKYGVTEEAREQQLKKAKIISIIYQVMGVIIAILSLFSPSQTIIAFSLMFPLLSVPVILSSRGLIKFVANTKSPYNFVLIGVMMPSIMMLIIAASDFHILDFSPLWLPVIATLIIFAGLLYFADDRKTGIPVKGRNWVIVIFSLLYAFGVIMQLNCTFDHSTERQFHAQVLDHRISHGKHTDYYITVSPWGPQTSQDEISVSRYRYYNSSIGSTVTMHLKKSLLNASWFSVSD